MNLKKKMRRGSLAALIALALTSSALAMPTGGALQSGDANIGGSTDFSTVASGSTISATTSSIINWEQFNILGGETLNFETLNRSTILNQVTGAQVSEILGHMNQTGDGELVLVNPNGIHVGGNAVLNVSDLTLSALHQTESPTEGTEWRGPEASFVNIDGNAVINATKEFSVSAGAVNVADGVIFNMGTLHSANPVELEIKAMDSAVYGYNNIGDDVSEHAVHKEGNDIVFNGTVNMLGGARDHKWVKIGGAAVTATGTKFHGDDLETVFYAASKYSEDERTDDRSNYRYSAEATAANKISLDRVEATGDHFNLGGGVIDVKNSNVNVYGLSMEAVSSLDSSHRGRVSENVSAPDRTVNIESSTLRAQQGEVFGGKITVADDVTFKLVAPANQETEMMMVAGNRYLQKRSEDHGNSLMEYRGAAGNEVAFHGTVEHEGAGISSFGIGAFSVNADRAKLHGNHFTLTALTKTDENHSEAAEGKASVERSAANRVQADGLTVKTQDLYIDGGRVDLKNSDLEVDWLGIYADAGNLSYDNRMARPDNVVSLKNVTIRPAYTKIYGGMVTMEGSTIETPTLTEILAGESYSIIRTQHGDQKTVVNVTKDNVIDLRHTTVTAPRVLLGAGKIGVWEGSTIAAGEADGLEVNLAENVTRTDGSAALYQRDAASHVTVNGIESPTFTETSDPVPPVPQPPVNPETPPLSEDDQANIDEGSAKAQIALTEATQGARSEALTKTIAKLNENAATSRRQTAGVIVGVIRAIAESNDLTAVEKTVLQIAALDAYAPVQEAKAVQDNTATDTLDEAVSAATNVSVAPVYPDETEAEETVSFTS